MIRRPPRSTLFPYTTRCRSDRDLVTELVYGTTRMRRACDWLVDAHLERGAEPRVRNVLRLGAYQLAFMGTPPHADRKSTRLNSSHANISYAVFCLKKIKN